MNDIETFLKAQLDPHQVEIRFGRNALDDLAGFDVATQQQIIVLLIRQGQKSPQLPPVGLGVPLHGELTGFAKIKPKKLRLRIVYRPRTENGITVMEIIAIGPRERDRVYKLAAERVAAFKKEMANR